MFERMSGAAERLATGVSQSRRGFLGRLVGLTGGAALAALTVAAPRVFAVKVGPYNCNCRNPPGYGCKTNQGYSYYDCVLACHSACGV